MDIVTLDNNFMYITEISHEIDPSTNKWWMNITGEWLKPFRGDLGLLKERERGRFLDFEFSPQGV